MANISTFFCFAKYWNRAALIIVNCKGFFSSWLDLDKTNNKANNKVNNKADDKANDKAFICFCGIIYLNRSFLAASLLTHWYPRAFGSMCDSKASEFLVEDASFFLSVSDSLFKIFFLGVTPSLWSANTRICMKGVSTSGYFFHTLLRNGFQYNLFWFLH